MPSPRWLNTIKSGKVKISHSPKAVVAKLQRSSSCFLSPFSVFDRFSRSPPLPVQVGHLRPHSLRVRSLHTPTPTPHLSGFAASAPSLPMASTASNGSPDVRSLFCQIYTRLKAELLEDPAFDFTEDARQWIEKMLDYNVPGGKLNRGLSVVDSYRLLKEGRDLSEEELFLSCVLGWCIEWLQAYFLVLDDIMDGSHTRRGQPCWFRVPKVGLIAANDGIILRNHVPRMLQKHFKGKPNYVDLLDLFNEVEFQTACGQMLDLITTHEGETDLSKYQMPVYKRIVQYKTAYYSFYLPVACALLMSGENLDQFVDVKNILIEMGTYFQVQDDYLDCFGDPKVIGKIGTDIEDFKCSWLVVQALERASETEKKTLYDNYGKNDPDCVAKVKAVYKDLDLQKVFTDYETASYTQLISSIEAQPSQAVQAVLKSFLGKIYKRQK